MIPPPDAPRIAGADVEGNVLLTGGTGLVGGAVLADLLETTGARVSLLVRARDRDHARLRICETLEPWLGAGGWDRMAHRVCAIPSDLERDDLGLDSRTRDQLVAATDFIVHAAASVRFDNPLQAARMINVGGARRILRLAQDAHDLGRLRRATMVSTAFVGGRVGRAFREYDLDVCQDFHNTYEQSKFEAELLIREHAHRLPVTVVRPSVVIGHSRTGHTTAFNVIYVPVRLFLRSVGRFTIPVRSMTPIDTVPVDWVAEVIREALVNGADGQTYAAASGHAHLTMDDMATLVADVFDVPLPHLLPADCSDDIVGLSLAAWAERLKPRSRSALTMFAPYLIHGSRFDTRWGDHLMRRAGLVAANPRAALRRSLEYARDTGFGRVLNPNAASGTRFRPMAVA